MALVGRNAEWIDSATIITLVVATTLSTLGVILNVNYFTDGGRLAPVLENFDMELDWRHAMEYLKGEPITDAGSWRHYSDFIIAVCYIFGRNLAVPLMFNTLFYGLSLILIGKIAYLATDDVRIARYALISGACVCYLLAQSMTLLKDVPMTLLMALNVFIMLRWYQQQSIGKLSAAAMLILIIVSIFMRSNSGLLIAAGGIIFAFFASGKATRTAFLAISVISLGCYFFLPLNIHSTNIPNIISDPASSQIIFDRPNTRAWDALMGSGEDAENLTLVRRIVWLPGAVVVQFLIPFPWKFSYYLNYGPSMILARFGYPWYLIGALILYWIGACIKQSPRQLKLLVFWGALLTLCTAFVTTGRISRYCLPYLPLLLPAAGWVIARCLHKRSLWIWLGIFVALLIPTLIVCYHLQGQFMS